MAATPKPIRKSSKQIAKSLRKDRPISMMNSSKQMIKKHAKSAEKLNSRFEKKDTNKR